ncbi:hypothetical protein HY407_01845 [Candidatus Gottesmanbacteria bacterium]|nr:hypothetical protein [Candidatus Gottesmanbacteria bacterium]
MHETSTANRVGTPPVVQIGPEETRPSLGQKPACPPPKTDITDASLPTNLQARRMGVIEVPFPRIVYIFTSDGHIFMAEEGKKPEGLPPLTPGGPARRLELRQGGLYKGPYWFFSCKEEPTVVWTIFPAFAETPTPVPHQSGVCEMPHTDMAGRQLPPDTEWTVAGSSFLIPVKTGGFYRGVVLYDETGSHVVWFYVPNSITTKGVYIADLYMDADLLIPVEFNIQIDGIQRSTEWIYLYSCLGIIYIRGNVDLAPLPTPTPPG